MPSPLDRRAFLRRAGVALPFVGAPATVSSASTASTPSPTTSSTPASAPDPRWSFVADSQYVYLPVVADGVVAAGTRETLYGFDAATGTRRWHTDGWTGVAPAFGDGATVVVRPSGQVRAVDLADGATRWQADPRVEQDYLRSSRVHDGRAVVVLGDRTFVFDLATGEEVWSAYGYLGGDVAPDSGLVYVSAASEVVARDLRTGERTWSILPPTDSARVLAETGSTLFLATGDETVAYDRTGGTERWRYTGEGRPTDAVFVDGRVLVAVRGETGTTVVSLDAADGTRQWTADLEPTAGDGGYGYVGDLVVGSGAVYFLASDRGPLVAAALDRGEVRWTAAFEPSTSLYTYHEGVLYVPTRSGVSAFDAADGTRRWHYQTPDRALYARVRGETLFVGAEGGHFYVFDTPTGTVEFALDAVREDPLTAVGVGALVAGAGGVAAYRRRERSETDDATPSSTVLEETDRRTVTRVDHAGSAVRRTAYTTPVSAAARAAFADAMETWESLDGRAVLPVCDWGIDTDDDGPGPWFETPAVDGTLDEAEDWESAAHALVRVCTALHEADVPHGDLRPADVFLSDLGDGIEAAVGGWGLGAFRRVAWGETPADSAFAAPEEGARAGESSEDTGRDVTAAAQVYRVGAVGESVLDAVVVPDEIHEVLATATADDPAERYDSLADLRVDLRWAAFARYPNSS